MSPYRPVFRLLAAFGFFGLNGVFIYYMLLHPDVMVAAIQNPISLVFIVEAFTIVAFAAWVIARVGLRQPGWGMFILMSIMGGLAFSVPFFLLLHLRKRNRIAGTGPRAGQRSGAR